MDGGGCAPPVGCCVGPRVSEPGLDKRVEWEASGRGLDGLAQLQNHGADRWAAPVSAKSSKVIAPIQMDFDPDGFRSSSPTTPANQSRLRLLWQRGSRDVEVLRAEVDRGGYDLVLECNRVLRHVQFKSSHSRAKTSEVSVNLNLAGKPSGCVIWVLFNPGTLALGPFLWFGGAPGQPLPPLGDQVARHSKANAAGYKAEKPNLRVIKRGRFVALTTMEEVISALFGQPGGSGIGMQASCQPELRVPATDVSDPQRLG
jgi:hypothetical protein